jgi:AraC-like DNA-binding protein
MSISSTQSGPPIVRQAHPMAFAAFLEHSGIPADHLLRQQGIAVFCDDPGEFVLLHRVWEFFEAAARSVDPMLGWHVGRFVGDHNLAASLLGRLEGEPTLYEALKAFVRLATSESSHLHIGIAERRSDILLFTHYPVMRGVPAYPVSQAYNIGVFVDLIRHFVGRSWVPEEVGIESREAPKVAEEMFPGCRILAQQGFGYVAVPRALLHSAACAPHPEARNEDSLVLTKDFSFAETLGTLLHAYLPGGYPSAQLAASLMDTSVTTLGRRLANCGTTYRSLVDRVRFRAAKTLLENTDMRVTDVGLAIGFDDSSNFARMFRRIAGLGPREFRRASQEFLR